MSGRILLEQLHNTRDLGGMVTADGYRIKPGRLIRSGHLFGASEQDIKTLSELVEVIVDFRTPGECSEKPNPKLAGVRYCPLPIMDSFRAGVVRDKEADREEVVRLGRDPEAAAHYMCDMYRRFVSDPAAVSGYRKFVNELLECRERAVLWHCTAGKDRAGFAAVITEALLGVDRGTILQDYLATNEYQKEDAEQLIHMFIGKEKNPDPKVREALGLLFGAKEEYLRALYDRVDEIYGDFETFLREGLEIDDTKRDILKEKYLER